MGTLTCPRCKATVQADSIENGRKKLDHAVGIYINKPCGDGVAELLFTGVEKLKKPEKKFKTGKIDNTFK